MIFYGPLNFYPKNSDDRFVLYPMIYQVNHLSVGEEEYHFLPQSFFLVQKPTLVIGCLQSLV